MSDDEGHVEVVDEDEGRRRMEEAQKSRAERMQQELAEYEEMRHEQREKEADEIRELRERRELRKHERKEEEKRLTELMAHEEVRRKTDEEERKRKKLEEERTRREMLEAKRREAEERLKPKKPNYVIQKKEGGEVVEPRQSFGVDDYQKSKEQMEEEKRAILAQRIQELNVSSLKTAELIEKVKEFYEHIRKLSGDKYDNEQSFKRRQYDMIELQERARQMTKGKKGVSMVQVDETFDRLADKYSGAPPKIQLCSKYERHTDHRTYIERQDLFTELAKEVPPPEITRIHPEGSAPAEEAHHEAPAAEEVEA